MGMERIEQLEEQLSSIIQTQLCNPENVDAKELGEVVDMLKDLSEFCYYKTVTEAMKKTEKEEEKHQMYYTSRRYPQEYDMNDYPRYKDPMYNRAMTGAMYYADGGHENGSGNQGGGGRYYMEKEYEYPVELRDRREGRSPISRKMYIESKELHMDKAKQMAELEKYMKELSTDITEMIKDATPEEKTVLQQKLNTLSSMIK